MITVSVLYPTKISYGFADKRDEEVQDIVDKGMKDGIVTLHIVKCGLSGPPDTGKTHMRALMLGRKRPRAQRQSTALARRADQVTPDYSRILDENVVDVKKSRGSHKWGVVDYQGMTKLIANTLFTEEYSSDSEAEEDTSESSVSPRPRLSPKKQKREATKIVEAIKKSLKGMKSKRNRKGLKGVRFVYFVDVGGQPQFQEILPNFIRCDINLLVHNLSQELDECPPFNYVSNGQKFTAPEHLNASNIEIMEQSVRSICSNMSYETKFKPHVAIVGMFKDQCSEDSHDFSKMVKKKSKKILRQLKDYCGPSGIGKCELIPSRQGHIFAINGSVNGWDKNSRTINDLKECIHQYAEKRSVKVPIRYFVFLQALIDYAERKKKFYYLTLEQCRSVAFAGDLFMKESDVKKALVLFDDCNVILYFPEVLPNIVFVKPGFLFGLTTKIITASFECENPVNRYNCNRVFNLENVHFRKSGVFTDALLKNIPSFKLLDKKFNRAQFLKLLQDLYIIAEVSPGKHLYFMPCVLPMCNPSSEKLDHIKKCMDENEVDGPLCISFTHRKSSRGMFCALLAALAGSPGWKLNELSDKPFRHRNLVEFQFYNEADELTGAVVVIDKKSHFEVYTTCPPSSCFSVQQTVTKSLENVCDKMKYSHNVVDFKGLPCMVSPTCKGLHSSQIFCDKRTRVWRERCSSTQTLSPLSLTPRRSIWFSEGASQCKWSKLQTMEYLFLD